MYFLLCTHSVPLNILSFTLFPTDYKPIMNKKTIKKYADLMHQAQQAKGRKEAVGLLHKAAKLKTKFDSYEMM